MDQDRARRRPVLVAIVWLIELGVILVIAEFVSVFLLPPGNTFYLPQPFYAPSARRIYGLQPNQSTYTHDKSFVTNSIGLREAREIPSEKGKEIRIVSLGDSMAMGLGVAAEDTYAAQLEARLAPHYAGIRVVNAGIEGYATWQEVDLLEEVGLRIQPDVVLLQMYWNDVTRKPAVVVPLQGGNPSGSKVLWFKRLLKRSRVLSLLRERAEGAWYSRFPNSDWKFQEMIYEGRADSYVDLAFEDIRSSLARFKELGVRHGFAPAVLILPMTLQVVRPDPPTELQRRLVQMTRDLGLPALDALAQLKRKHEGGSRLFIPWEHTHLSREGHTAIAEILERFFKDHGFLDRAAAR